MALRICRDCGKKAITIEDLGKFHKHKKSKYERENLCNRCHKLRYWTPEYHKKWREANPNYMKNKFKKRIRFKDKYVLRDKNPRSNVCSECGKSYPEDLKRQTSMHHIIYDETDPLAWTVELCQSCHMKLHHTLKKFNQ